MARNRIDGLCLRPRQQAEKRAGGHNAAHPAVRRESNLNFLFRLSLKFYRLVSSSVARGSIPERSEASPKTARSSRPRRNQAMEPVTNRQLRKEPSGDRPDGSFYCWPALAGARPFNQITRSITPLRRCRSQCSHSIVVDSAPWSDEVRLCDLEPKFTYNAAAPR